MIKKLSIKSHGVTFTIPSEILILKKTFFIAELNDHLVLDKVENDGQYYFIVLRKNGVVIPSKYFINPVSFSDIEYKECSVETYYKLRAFL